VFDAAENPGDKGPSGKVGSVVFVSPSVLDERNVSMAFTTGSPLFEDNFDRDGHYQEVPIENCIFGALKLLLEMHAFKTLPNTPENKEKLWKQMYVIHKKVAENVREGKFSEDDPVVRECMADLPEEGDIESMKHWSYGNLLNRYLQIRYNILDELPNTIPKIAKEAIGRNTCFEFIKGPFEDEELRLWGVYFARLFFLRKAATIDNGVYPLLYTMLHKFGNQQEWSKFDDVWAMKNKTMIPSADSGPLCYFKAEYNGDSAAEEARRFIMEHTIPPSQKKLLGRANDWVANKLQMDAGSVSDTRALDFSQREARAKQMLIDCEWTRWFNSHFRTREMRDVIGDFHFKGELRTMIQNIELSHVLNLLKNIDDPMIGTRDSRKRSSRGAVEAPFIPPGRRSNPLSLADEPFIPPSRQFVGPPLHYEYDFMMGDEASRGDFSRRILEHFGPPGPDHRLDRSRWDDSDGHIERVD